MNSTLYQFYSTISDKISKLFLNYASCLVKKQLSIENPSKIDELIQAMDYIFENQTVQSPKKDSLMKLLRDSRINNKKVDFYLSLKLLIEIYVYSDHRDLFTRSFIRLIMKEILLLRNLFFHSTDYTDEHIFRFFQNIYFLFKNFEYPNNYWIEMGYSNFKEDNFVKYDLRYALKIGVMIIQENGYSIEEKTELVKKKTFFETPINLMNLKQIDMDFIKVSHSNEDRKFMNTIKIQSFELGEKEMTNENNYFVLGENTKKIVISEPNFDNLNSVIPSTKKIKNKKIKPNSNIVKEINNSILIQDNILEKNENSNEENSENIDEEDGYKEKNIEEKLEDDDIEFSRVGNDISRVLNESKIN